MANPQEETLDIETSVRFSDGSGNYVILSAPSSIGTDVQLILPVNIESGKVLMVDGSGQLSWTNNNPGTPEDTVWEFGDVKTIGTSGGTFSNNTWITRDLNTSFTDNTNTDVTLSSNTLVIVAGTYYVEASVPAFRVGLNTTRLRNVTDGTTTLMGTSEFSSANNNRTQSRSFLSGTFTIASTKTFSLQHQCSNTRNNDGLGRATGIQDETYSKIKIAKLA